MKTLLLIVLPLTVAVQSTFAAAEALVMQRGVKLFSDRDYVIDEVPDAVRGLPFLRGKIGRAEAVVTKAGTLFALTPVGPRASSQEVALKVAGFEKVEVPEVRLLAQEPQVRLFRKAVKAGERVAFGKLVVLVPADGAETRGDDGVAAAGQMPKPSTARSAQLDRGSPMKTSKTEVAADVPTVTLAEIAKRLPSANPAVPNLAPGLDVGEDNRIWQGIPSLAISPKGRIWVSFMTGGSRWEYDSALGMSSYTVLYTSGDGGKSFKLIASIKSRFETEKCHAGDSALWIDPEGRMWWMSNENFPQTALQPREITTGLVAHVTANPDNEHPTWEPARIIAPGVLINKPTVCSDGTWLIAPSFSARHRLGRWKPDDFEFKGVFVFSSRDQGQSFSFLSGRDSTPAADAICAEAHIVEQRDGALALYMRTTTGIQRSLSRDQGRAWSLPEPVPDIDAKCGSRFFIRRLDSGRLLLVYNKGRNRLYMTAALSDDDGKTWKGGLRLDDRDDLPDGPPPRHQRCSTYPDGQQAADGTIWIVYDMDRYAADGRQIVLARFREDDILAGKIVSPDSRLKILVSQATAPRPNYKVGDKSPVGEVLHNGIRLPFLWPPRHLDPQSAEPMPVPYLKNPPKVIPIDVGRQLFVDDFLIEKTDLKRTFHQAQKHPANPVFKAETAEEIKYQASIYLGHGGVFFDPSEHVFKMFYLAGMRGGLALATSTDLIHWTRPELGLVGGNLLLPAGPRWTGPELKTAGSDNCVWLDVAATSPAERIKFLTCWWHVPEAQLPTGFRHSLHVSDGRTWSPGKPTGMAQDYCSFFFNPFRNVWVFSIKQGGSRGRCRYYSESRDFLQGADWSKSVYWTNADRLDKPEPADGYPGAGEPTQLYSLSAVAYESVMLGMHMILRGPRNEICEKEKFPKLSDLCLGFSRDGFHWDRPDRRPFIAASRKEGNWDRAYLHTTTGVCVVMDDKLWFPYTGFSGISPDGTRGMYRGGSTGIATLRRDGFASMDAMGKSGTLTTRPLTFKGEHLFVNVNTPSGELRVEVLDEKGNALAISKPMTGDTTKQRIEWNGAADLAALSRKPTRLRFTLTNGSLYSFWITDDKNGASHGYVGAGGPGFNGTRDEPCSTKR